MSRAETGVDYKSRPKDFDAFFRSYYSYTVALVKKYGITEANKEDVAAEIFLRLYERGWLDFFDPTLTFEYDGKIKEARFKTFFSYAVVGYVRGHRDKQARRADRELLVYDKPTFYNEVASTWAEWFGVEAEESHEDLILDIVVGEQIVDEVRAYLATVPKRSAYDQCNLVEFFNAVLAQIDKHDRVVLAELREQFDKSVTGINGWMWWLRANISDYLGVPMPAKRVRRTAE